MVTPKISLVIPVYNEAQAIGETVRSIREHLSDAEILVIDDAVEVAQDGGDHEKKHDYR